MECERIRHLSSKGREVQDGIVADSSDGWFSGDRLCE